MFDEKKKKHQGLSFKQNLPKSNNFPKLKTNSLQKYLSNSFNKLQLTNRTEYQIPFRRLGLYNKMLKANLL